MRRQFRQPAVAIHLLRLSVNGKGDARYQQQGNRQRAQQGIPHRESHRREQFLFNPLESEQRHIGNDDYQRGKENGLGNFHDAADNGGFLQRCRLIVFPLFQNRFHHHNRAVHQYAEVHRSQRKQVGGNIGQVHQDESNEQRQGNGDGNKQCAPPAAEENNQDGNHQYHSEEQGVRNGVQGCIHQICPVHEGVDFHAFGQDFAVEFINGFVHFRQYLRGVLIAQHLDDAFHAVGIIADGVDKAQDAFAFEVAVFQGADVAQVNRHTVHGLYDDVRHVAKVADKTDAAHHVAQIAAINHAAAGIAVVAPDGFRHFRERKIVFVKLYGVNLNLVLGGDAAKVADVRDTADLPQAGNDHPFVQVGQIAQGTGVAFYNITVDFSCGRSERVQFRTGVVRQIDVVDAFRHTLPRPIIIFLVIKNQHDDGQSEGVLAAHHVQVGDAVQFPFQRNGNLLLYFFGGKTGYLRHNLHRHIGYIRIGIQRKLRPCINPENGDNGKNSGNQPTAVEKRGYQLFHISCPLNKCRRRRQ
ncbi:hypothetical protein Barb4_02461 [Bacteroidales bacterium Barb4]|nr:hypothetical protein Barb4_02461 [Bacteroidales bacterium Barb4]